MIIRIILTLLLLIGFSFLCFAVETYAPLVSGPASVAQLSDTDQGYVTARTAATFNGHVPFVGVAVPLANRLGDLKLPNFLFVSDQLANALGGFLKAPEPAATPAPKK